MTSMHTYEVYKASPDALREQAHQARSSLSAIHQISDDVAGRHQRALAATDGELTLSLSGANGKVTDYSSNINRQAIWAALQVENFADAIEVYNTESTDPMSIQRLNTKVQEVQANGIFEALCEPVLNPTPQMRLQREAEYQHELDKHYQRLEGNLDDAAGRVARNLRNGPNDAAIIRAWKAGNLPPYAALAWPELDLRDIPIEGVDPSMLDITTGDFPGLLTDPNDPPTQAELEWLRLNFPEEMGDFAENWELEGNTLPAGEAPAGLEDVEAPNGWIQGPDGAWYPIQVPAPHTPSGDGHVVSAPPGGITGWGWTTVDHRQGPIYAGEEPNRALNIINGILGGRPELQGPQSIGENQTDYITYDSDGNIWTHDKLPEEIDPWGIARGAPSSQLSSVPNGTYDPTAAMEASDRYIRTQSASNLFSLAVGGAEGALLNNQIDANNSYAGNVTFQEGPDGTRRAVVQLGQLEHGDDGEIQEDRTYGVLDEDGAFQRQSEP